MATHPPPAGPFKVLAANVNGLSAQQKRRGFFAFLQEQHCGVALLSETHCTSDSQAKGWVQEGAVFSFQFSVYYELSLHA